MDENTASAATHPMEPWQDHQQPETDMETGLVAKAGAPREPDEPAPVSKDGIIEALRTVYDPEIPVNIYELGLVYELEVNETSGDTKVTMTLTAPYPAAAGGGCLCGRARNGQGRGVPRMGPAVGHGEDVGRGQAGARVLLG